MNEESLQELLDYNLEYTDALNSEEIFGGDYTSAVELKYAKKEIERLHSIIKEVREYIEYYGRDKQLEEEYLMSAYNLANYNITLLEILDKVD